MNKKFSKVIRIVVKADTCRKRDARSCTPPHQQLTGSIPTTQIRGLNGGQTSLFHFQSTVFITELANETEKKWTVMVTLTNREGSGNPKVIFTSEAFIFCWCYFQSFKKKEKKGMLDVRGEGTCGFRAFHNILIATRVKKGI